jgi:hypothetical protein
VYQTPIACLGCTAIAEKGFVDVFTIDRKRLILCAIGAQAATVLVNGRGRDPGYPGPPAQIRTCTASAYGSYLGLSQTGL